MANESEFLERARSGDELSFAALVGPYRTELRAHCYRLAGSLHDADDLLQESLLRIWKGLGSFEGRSSLRTWLYKVTTSACLDALDKKSARALPSDLGGPADPRRPMRPPPEDVLWLEPCPEEFALVPPPAPDARYDAREAVTLAFLTALQLLPARQRAVVLLRDVLGWQASECAELLQMSIAAVNSALQRGRETLESRAVAHRAALVPPDDTLTVQLLARYVRAWEQADVAALVEIMHEDARLAMPPIPDWLQGSAAIAAALRAMVLPPEAAGRFRLLPLRANGLPGFAAYERDAGGAFRPRAIHLVEIANGRIAGMTAFLDASLFPRLGLPAELG